MNRGKRCLLNPPLTRGKNRIARSILTFRFEALPSKVSSGASPRSEPFEFTCYTLRHTFWDPVPVSQNLILAQRHYDSLGFISKIVAFAQILTQNRERVIYTA